MRSRKKLTRCGSTSAVDDEVRAGGEGARQSWRDQLAKRIIELVKASERNPSGACRPPQLAASSFIWTAFRYRSVRLALCLAQEDGEVISQTAR
jgi:hypothetical protein